MILIADGGSTKTDWIALNNNKEETFKVRTLGLNPAILSKTEIENRINDSDELVKVKDEVTAVFFYGAGCGTKISEVLQNALQHFFRNANVKVAEDMLGAVYATTGTNPAIVCILGTGSNSCYYNGKTTETITQSLGYTVMDEASGNYFGKILLRDYFYKKMPENIASEFEKTFDLNVDTIKLNLYQKPNPNMYLASFARFMVDFESEPYINNIIKNGFNAFFEYRILSHNKPANTPIYFVGSIAFYFKHILEEIAKKHQFKIAGVIRRPIDNLVDFHRNNIV